MDQINTRSKTLHRVFLPLSLGLNLMVLLALVWLFNGGGSLLILNLFVTPGKERLESLFEDHPVNSEQIVMVGDSITEGGSWHELLPGLPVANRGIPGDTSAGVLARIDQIGGGQPAAMLLMIGTNDLFAGTPETEIVANISEILTQMRRLSPQTKLVLQTVLPREASYRKRVESLNRKIAALAVDGVQYLDLYPLFLDPVTGGMKAEYSNDWVHLMGAGYRVWQAELLALTGHQPAFRE